MVQAGMAPPKQKEEGLHTHIMETERGGIIAVTKGGKLHWKTFLFFEALGAEYVFAAMPHLRSYSLYSCGT